MPANAVHPQIEKTRRKNRRRNSTHIRIPKRLKARLARLRDDIQKKYVGGQVKLPGHVNPEYVPEWYVIEKALDELEDHRVRSARSRGRNARRDTVVAKQSQAISAASVLTPPGEIPCRAGSWENS